MRRSRVVVRMFSVGLMVLGAGVVSAQTTSPSSGQAYPYKPIRIVTAAAGGGGDLVARLIAQGISGPLGQPVIVDNRAGSVVIPAEVVNKSSPEGYTLLLHANSFWIGTLLEKTPYDPVRDFLPISMLAISPQVLAVHTLVPAKSVKEMIALAKAAPGELNYAAANSGSSSHLAGELFKAMAGVDIVRISYKSTAAALTAAVGGEVQLLFTSGSSATPHVKSGRLRALAVTGAEPSLLFPGLPTVAATLPGFQATTSQAIFAPAQTPAAIINRLNQEIVRVLNRTDVKERLFNAGSEVVGSSPAQLAAEIKSDMARMGKVIKEVGIRAD